MSIPFMIVVLSPPGITSPSRPARPAASRTSPAWAPSSRSIRVCASKSPWMASTPTRRGPALSGTAVLEERVRGGKLGDLEAGHRLAELGRGGGDPLGVVEVRSGLDDRLRAPLRVGALEDPGADEVALGAELHHQR